jgi:hypothetical protein
LEQWSPRPGTFGRSDRLPFAVAYLAAYTCLAGSRCSAPAMLRQQRSLLMEGRAAPWDRDGNHD